MRALIGGILVLAFGFAGAAATAQSLPNIITPASPASPDSDNATIAVPPAPAIVAAPLSIPTIPAPAAPVPPGLVQAVPPADVDNGDSAPSPDQTAVAPTPDGSSGQGQATATPDNQDADIAPIPPNTWLPATTAKIGVLDKIDGSVSELTIPVGGQSSVGDLQVNVQACMTRPPDQVPDAAIFLTLQNTGNLSAPPNYRGWLLRSAPGAAVAGDASETFRVIDCT